MGDVVGADDHLRGRGAMRKARELLVIDDEGEAWCGRADRARKRLGGAADSEDFPGFAIHHLGFVEIRSEPAATLLRLRPSRVTPKALAGVFYHLADSQPRRIVINHFSEEWTHEICPSLDHALARIDALCRIGAPRRGGGDYLTARKPLEGLAAQQDHALAGALRAWQDCEGRADAEMVAILSAAGVLDRALVAEHRPQGDRLVIAHWGAEIGRCARMPPLLPGQDVETGPDRDYAAWAGRSYRQAMEGGQPVYEQVDAIIRPPGRAPIRRQYERLILTWSRPGGGRLVTNASVVNPKVEL